MYLVDYHIHTSRCGHACGADRDYVESAIKRGLKEMGFADHVPRFYQPAIPDAKVTERGMDWEDLEEYIESVLKFREEYREISIKLGLEMDFVPGWEEETARIIAQYPWDYVIGSVHFIPEWSYGYIPNERDRKPEEVYPRYFEQVARAAESGLFDFLGHIDLPKRSFPRLAPEEMTRLYQELAERLGKANAVIEINSYGLRCSKDRLVGIYPDPELLGFCRQQGVAVTLGSDSHRPEDVAADFDQALLLMRQAGYSQLTVFNRRRASVINWEE